MNVIVIGDIMLDINHICESTRMAPEADIPVYNIKQTTYILGGAGNVAYNFKKIDMNVEIITVLGIDEFSNNIQNNLKLNGIQYKCFFDNARPTTLKTRLFLNNKLVNRHDKESTVPIDINLELQIINYLRSRISEVNAIIISDYNKGVISENLCKQIIKIAKENNVYTFVDPKTENIEKYNGCFCIKPNLIEAKIISNAQCIGDIFKEMHKKINVDHIIITAGKDGMYVDNEETPISHNMHINVIDVTGAGDIALCIIVYAWLIYKDWILAAKMANYICGKSVEVIGNYTLSLKNIYDYFIGNKIIYDIEINKLRFLNSLKRDKKIVFTNGCFDIIHSAHIKLLKYAKQQGDILIVGLNSDNSIKNIKGQSRPINVLQERAELLFNLDYVDYIVIFEENTPFTILSHLKPNILIKGGDYNVDTIIGKEFCEQILLFNYIEGKSSTNVIKTIMSI